MLPLVPQTYRTIASFVTGPHVENQIMLLEHNIQDPLLLYLTYMEFSEQAGHEVDYTRAVSIKSTML